MVKYKSNTVWSLYPPGRYPQAYVSAIDKTIRIDITYEQAISGDVVKLTRRQARLLARRILQCLDETKKNKTEKVCGVNKITPRTKSAKITQRSRARGFAARGAFS